MAMYNTDKENTRAEQDCTMLVPASGPSDSNNPAGPSQCHVRN